MKTALFRASFIAMLFLPSTFAGGWEMKGGIVYWLHTGYSCPPFFLTNSLPDHFAIEKKVGVVCPFGALGNQRSLYTFVLGPLAAGTYWMKESGDLSPPNAPEVPFTVPASSEQLITNLTLNVSGQVSFHINGYGVVHYVIQKTSDFKSWIDADTLVGESDFSEQAVSADPIFYRIKIVSPPPTILL
jgi:hypothetical protein